MAKNTAFENGKISKFQGLMTVTLDRVILHTVVYHSSTSIYKPNFIEIKETFCGQTDVRMYVLSRYVSTYVQTNGHLRPTLLGRLGRVDLKITAPAGVHCLTLTFW